MYCDNREKLHVVDWTSDTTVCEPHWDAPTYSHLLMKAKMFLIGLHKQFQKRFRSDHDRFPICNIKTMLEYPKGLACCEIVLPIQFLDLIHWATLRDFGQSVSKDSD